MEFAAARSIEQPMARVFITGSSDGLGLMAAQLLLEHGHEVVLHARNEKRAEDARSGAPNASACVIGDLGSLAGMREVAAQVNALGSFDAVIHNAAVGYKEKRRVETPDGLAKVFAVNSLAPYVLTALIAKPKRLIYVSSELHKNGDPSLKDLQWKDRQWGGTKAYSDSKLHNVLLAFAVARRWPQVLSNAIEPGWVATKMGGPNATGNLDEGHRTQVWLAEGEDPAANVSGGYFFHRAPRKPLAATHELDKQEAFLAACEQLSGIRLPA